MRKRTARYQSTDHKALSCAGPITMRKKRQLARKNCENAIIGCELSACRRAILDRNKKPAVSGRDSGASFHM
jgi:hypothetical protein